MLYEVKREYICSVTISNPLGEGEQDELKNQGDENEDGPDEEEDNQGPLTIFGQLAVQLTKQGVTDENDRLFLKIFRNHRVNAQPFKVGSNDPNSKIIDNGGAYR